MHRQELDFFIDLILLTILFTPIIVGTASSQNESDNSVELNQLVLTVYIDDSGKALINGYVDDPGSLAFLNSSKYTYEENSRQLYAITSALTSKSKDNWTASIGSNGSYDDYQIMLYLPTNAKLRQVDCSPGLDYLVYAANESVITEIRGSDITNPAFNIEYLLPLAEAPRAEANPLAEVNAVYPYKTIAALFFFWL